MQVTGDQVTLVDAAGNSANVITGDVAASNGVIHIIDAVLLPTASPAAQEIAATPTQAGQDSQHRSDRSASTGTHFAPESVPRQRQTAKTSVRVLVGLNYVAMIAVNALANILPINGRNTGEISDSYENLFAPAGLTFSIWGVIYLLLGTHVLYQLGLFRGAELDDGPRLGGGARVGADEVSPRADLLQRVGGAVLSVVAGQRRLDLLLALRPHPGVHTATGHDAGAPHPDHPDDHGRGALHP